MDIFDISRFSYISPLTAATTLLVVLLGILYYALRDSGIPPGPRGLPFLGYWPFLKDETAHIHLTDLKKKYGDVYSFTSVGYLFIHLGTLKAIKEAHVTKSDCFADRYTDFSLLQFLFGDGLACANGEAWRVTRKFFVQKFRELGLTSMKEYMTGPIYDSLASTVENLRLENGKAVNVISTMTLKCSTIVRRMLFNDDGISEEEMQETLETYGRVIILVNASKLLLMGEFARQVILPLSANYKLAVENHKKMRDILKKIVKRRESTFDKDNVRDLIDSYFKERNDRRSRNDPSSEYFTESSLVSNLVQFTGDGILGVTIFISYYFYALLEYPEEQDKIFKELEEVVGPDRQPTLDDKNKLPYTNAFLQEVNRTTDFFTLFPSLMCTRETSLYGYKIPKGAITIMNLWASHRDPNIFEDPDAFKPSRYVSEPGKQKTELPIPFGIGKRSCIGESFTMMMVFLFVTTIVKNFHLTAPEGFNKKTFLDGNMEICCHPRK